MSKVLAIAWREFKQTVLRKIFLLAVLGIPVLVLSILAVAGVMMATHEEPPLVGTVAIIDPTGELSAAAQIEFDEEQIRSDSKRAAKDAAEALQESSGVMTPTGAGSADALSAITRGVVDITIEQISSDDEADLDDHIERVRNETILALAIVEPRLLEPPQTTDPPSSDADEPPAETSQEDGVRLFVGENVDSDHVSLIERRLGKSIVRVRAQRSGYDPEDILALLKRPEVHTKRTLATGDEADASEGFRIAAQMIPMAFMMLIWIGTLTSGQHLLMTTIEEKSNRVMEVLLSAVSPLQLMTGKILGHGGVGLLIVLLYSSVGIAVLIIFSLFTQFLSIMDLVYLAVFYFMAYFMIASLMAAVGSAVSEIREANTLVTPVMMLLMIPWILWMPITQAPNGMVAKVCSFVPPMIPFAMILRHVAEEDIPAWHYPVSIIWGYVCVLGMIWFAAKIFRVGVLMYGKPPSPLQLIKWARYS